LPGKNLQESAAQPQLTDNGLKRRNLSDRGVLSRALFIRRKEESDEDIGTNQRRAGIRGRLGDRVGGGPAGVNARRNAGHARYRGNARYSGGSSNRHGGNSSGARGPRDGGDPGCKIVRYGSDLDRGDAGRCKGHKTEERQTQIVARP
jgi:hypothetical protein